MKRLATVVLSALLTVFCFTACSQEKEMEYIAWEVGGHSMFSSPADRSSDSAPTAENIKIGYLEGTRKTFSYNGTDYEAVYDHSQIQSWANSSKHIYKYKGNGIWIDFGENIRSGRLDYYNCHDWRDRSENTVKIQKSKEECLQIAKAYLGKYVDDPNAYEVDGANTFDLTEGLTYFVRLSRRVNGIPASDKANISVTEYGEIIAHHFVSLGEFKDFSLPDQDQMQKIQDAFDARLASIYSSTEGKYNYSYKLYDQELIKLEDGRYLLERTYHTTLTRIDGEQWQSHDHVALVVQLNK
jgi:hypothetical protein